MSVIGRIVGKLTGADSAAKAAQNAANTQAASAQAGIDEQRRQFDALQALLKPFVEAGRGGLSAYQDLAGLGAPGSQQAAIDALKASPQYTSQLQAGQDAILANASATGGLRGGNVQAALGQFAPALLAQTINDRFSQLGGLTTLGQNSAAGVGNAGLQTGNNIANLLQQQGAATAGGQIARGSVAQQGFGTLLQLGSIYAGSGGLGGLFGGGGAGVVSGGSGLSVPGFTAGGSGGLYSLGGSGVKFSDRRLKRNVRRIGTSPRGHAWYRWDWIDGSGSAEGVMAQEVQHIPGAVSVHPSGFLMVDYSKV